jgi:hypothetical protein
MSQTLQQLEPAATAVSSLANTAPAAHSVAIEPGFDEFAYKPIPPLAPVSLLLGICALAGLLSVLGLIFGLFGFALGWVCLRQIKLADGGLGGLKLARSGVFLSAALFASGLGLHVYWYLTELPEGYQRVNFSQDISRKGFVIEDNRPRMHPDVQALDGQKLFVKGYMYPIGEEQGLTDFILCRDNGQCCFGGQPKLTDMIKVKMEKGTATYSAGMVSVAGVFRLRDLSRAGNLEPAYELDAAHFGPAKTTY